MMPHHVHPMAAGLYAVDLGRGRCSDHIVENGACRCGDPGCTAPALVGEYLQAGGCAATPARDDFDEIAPARCPICQGGVLPKAINHSRTHGAGWTCTAGGDAHYWQHRSNIIQRSQTRR